MFLIEYFGPLVIYPVFYFFPQIYGETGRSVTSHSTAVKWVNEWKSVFFCIRWLKWLFIFSVALVCWSIHYAKRLLETQFVHRFSHGTMPILNLAKNCSYYWGFAAFISYFVNHPLYTPPSFGSLQLGIGLLEFVIGESGNLAIHLAFKNLRPPGSKVRSVNMSFIARMLLLYKNLILYFRKIPKPTGNVFTKLFGLVSCPNYTYEALSWLGFSVMTQCLPGKPHIRNFEK